MQDDKGILVVMKLRKLNFFLFKLNNSLKNVRWKNHCSVTFLCYLAAGKFTTLTTTPHCQSMRKLLIDLEVFEKNKNEAEENQEKRKQKLLEN